MKDFTFKSPTEFIFGKDTESKTGEYLKKYGAKKVFVHYGGGSAKKSGLLDRVLDSIKKENIAIVQLGGVQPNPRVSLVREGIRLCKNEGVDFLLAVGGGSVIDSLKAISIGLAYDGDVWDFFEGKVTEPNKVLPIGIVLTIPAAGSEGSPSMVITNEAIQVKSGFDCQASRATFSILNPVLTNTLPTYQTGAGTSDMMAHIMERYFTNTPNVGLNDRLCESLLKTIMQAATRLMVEPEDYNARADLMWASSLAHTDLLSCGRVGDWASHNIEHELSAFYDVTHGAGLAIVFPAWMKFVYQHDIMRFCQFASRVFNVEIDYFDPERTAREGIAALEVFFKSIGMPVRLAEIGITDNRFEEMANRLTKNDTCTCGHFVPLTFADCKAIYELMV